MNYLDYAVFKTAGRTEIGTVTSDESGVIVSTKVVNVYGYDANTGNRVLVDVQPIVPGALTVVRDNLIAEAASIDMLLADAASIA